MGAFDEIVIQEARPLPLLVLADTSGSMSHENHIGILNEAMREMNEVNALMNMYMKTGETDKAMKVYNKNKDLIAWRSTYVKTNTQITKINRQIKFIESQNISEREKYLKVKQLNLLKAQIMRTLKENVLAYEKANDTRVKRPLWWK